MAMVLSGVHCTRGPEIAPVTLKSASIESSCFDKNKSFIGKYFSGKTQVPALDSFFDCIDNLIQALLNHTQTKNPEYYTQVELSRFILYMGGAKKAQTEELAKAQAKKMSQALLNLKVGFIGGPKDRLTLKEIALCRHILTIFRKRMRLLLPSIPSIIKALRGDKISKKAGLQTSQILKDSLSELSAELAHFSFSADLSLLKTAPQNIQILTGLQAQSLKYWSPSVLILDQWQKMFATSHTPKQVIKSTALPALLSYFGEFSALWLYHNQFLKGKFYLDYAVVRDTQYFLSRSLEVVDKALKASGHKHISLKDVDELARRLWFLPALSRPVFRLGLRSVSCFLLKPLVKNKVCEHSKQFEENKVTIRFADMSWTITDKKDIQESLTNQTGDSIGLAELKILRQYLDSWSQAEHKIRSHTRGLISAELLSSLFGISKQWFSRKIDVQNGRRLSFNVHRADESPLFSWLNWQSHLMQLSAKAYTNRVSQPIDQELWNVMIKEWTALAVALYPPLKWEQFQSAGFQMFSHGDLMTAHSNGDRILQAEELLEIFSLSVSSADMLFSSLALTEHCHGAPAYSLPQACLFETLSAWPADLFSGFPILTQKLSTDQEARSDYISILKSFYGEEDFILYKDIFKMFLIIHYQANMMEYLDKDNSLDLSAQELTALMPIFAPHIIEEFPFIKNEKEAFALVTYLFHYGEIPFIGKKGGISDPIRFSNWLLHPEKWKLNADQLDLLKAILSVNQTMGSLNFMAL